MTRQPALRAGLRCEIIDDSCAVLCSGVEAIWLHGSAYPLLLPLLDGGHTALELGELLAARLAPEQVHYALAVLERRGLIGEPCHDLPSAPAAFWTRLGVAPALAARRLSQAEIGISPFDPADRLHWELREALESWHVSVRDPGSLQVVIAADYLAAGLDGLNRRALASGRSWMLVNPGAGIACIGPVFRPGQTACWECLVHRLRENRLTLPWPGPAAPCDSARSLALRLAVQELVKWTALDGKTALDGALLTFDHATLALSRHVVARRPDCPACGGLRPEPAHSGATRGAPDGWFRAATAEQTLARLAPLVSPVTGIVASVELISSAGGGYGCRARLNGPLGSAYHALGLRGRPLSAWGKGATPEQARLSCLAEAVERYSICVPAPRAVKCAPGEVLGDSAIDPRSLLQFSAEQYRGRERWNRGCETRLRIPELYDPAAPIDWVEAWSVTSMEPRWVPAAFCYLDYGSRRDRRFFQSDSNGCASGNTVDEAVLQGFLELVERDAIALWWYNRVRRPEVNFAGSVEFATILDLTTDLGIPVIAAVAKGPRPLHAGFGAHLDPRLALRSALSELRQQQAARAPAPVFTPDSQPQLEPLPETTDLRAYCYHGPSDPCGALQYAAAIARRQALEILVVNMTRPDIGFPVVRVISPGLRHYKPRFAPGRLYDVPVHLGWVPRPVPECELNPIGPPI